ncbi:hypothetical protein [Romboutsia sp.]
MKTSSMFCSLSKKCKVQYSKEISENLSKENEQLENLYNKDQTVEK